TLGSPGGDKDVGLQARSGGVAGQGGGGVAGGGAGDDLGAGFPGLGHSHGAGTVLQGGGGVDAVVLHVQLFDAQLFGQGVGLVQGAPAHPQGGVGSVLLYREKLPVAPHGV